MKNITIAGNIGRSAETRSTQNGSVTGFYVAVSGRKKDDPPTWFDVGLWGKRGETLCQYLTKGTKVVVSGDFFAQEGKDGKTYLKVSANEVTLMGGGEQRQESRQEQPADLDDCVPF